MAKSGKHRKLQKSLGKINEKILDAVTTPGSMALPAKNAFRNIDELKNAANVAIKSNAGHSKTIIANAMPSIPKHLTGSERALPKEMLGKPQPRPKIPEFLRKDGPGTNGGHKKRNTVKAMTSKTITPEMVEEMKKSSQATVDNVNNMIKKSNSQNSSATTLSNNGGLVNTIASSAPMKAVAGASVATLVMGNMVRSKGQQSNSELYGQRTPYM